ncbi:MAG: Holliday junction branch migration protein RuvA [Clostridia bacterium]|nr:Holliday junction branch migration protein RuvA [Clostridia bacterium]
MFAYIRGTLEEKGTDFVVIDVQGVGYKIFAPATTIQKLGEIGNAVKVHTYLQVREDDMSLYGFSSKDELRLFELLIGVSGIGAKSANTILANISPSKLALAVITNDVKELTKLPGIGAKSAQRMILELKDKLKTEDALLQADMETTQMITSDNNLQEAISALQVLGYPAKDAAKAVTSVDTTGLNVEEIIKQSLKYFAN